MTPAELRERRAALRLSQQKLGGALGVAANTVARWERGEVPIVHPEMLRLALEALEDQAMTRLDQAAINTIASEIVGCWSFGSEAPTVEQLFARVEREGLRLEWPAPRSWTVVTEVAPSREEFGGWYREALSEAGRRVERGDVL